MSWRFNDFSDARLWSPSSSPRCPELQIYFECNLTSFQRGDSKNKRSKTASQPSSKIHSLVIWAVNSSGLVPDCLSITWRRLIIEHRECGWPCTDEQVILKVFQSDCSSNTILCQCWQTWDMLNGGQGSESNMNFELGAVAEFEQVVSELFVEDKSEWTQISKMLMRISGGKCVIEFVLMPILNKKVSCLHPNLSADD